jgi:hypothetical protein
MITVFVGRAFAQFATATASSPESGPTITSALACCISRRVSLRIVAGVSSPHP